jgi:hypothetical protein
MFFAVPRPHLARRFVRSVALIAGLISASAWLGGCALSRVIDSEVQSFAGASVPVSGAEFRFERLPSQEQNASQQEALEAMAQEALERVGLKRKDGDGRYLALVGFSVDGIRNPYYRPQSPRFVMGNNGVLMEAWPRLPEVEVPWFRHRLQLTLRDTHSGQVAYETSAVFDGPWRDTLNLLPPMLEAALQDYPNTSKRVIRVELPSRGAGSH